MLYEMEKALEALRKLDGTIRLTPDREITLQEVRNARKYTRQEVDELIIELLAGNREGTARELADVMYMVAGSCIQFGCRPEGTHFTHAAKQMLENARMVIDKGLQVRDWKQVQMGAVIMHITILGIALSIDVPYFQVFAEVHKANMEKTGIDSEGRWIKPEGWAPPDVAGVLKLHEKLREEYAARETGKA